MADYPDDFQKAVDDLIDNWEGTIYVKTVGDAGGGTKFGISSAAYPNLDIKNLTRDDAIKIYYYDYWLKQNHPVPVPDAFRAKVFNMGVLMGALKAKVLLVGCNTLAEYKLICVRHFQAIVVKHPEDGKFLKGWTRRALA
jgi:lysozyme family protein